MAKKSKKQKAPKNIFLDEDDIIFKMKDLQRNEPYQSMDTDKLRIIAIEMLFEENDNE